MIVSANSFLILFTPGLFKLNLFNKFGNHKAFNADLYYFQETRFFVLKIEIFDELQLP